jgi:hypothetical protein
MYVEECLGGNSEAEREKERTLRGEEDIHMKTEQ